MPGVRRHTGCVVNLSNAKGPMRGIGNVFHDNLVVGRMAGEFFLSEGVESFAYFGADGLQHSEERKQGFEEALGQKVAGYSSEVDLLSAVRSRKAGGKRMGLFCANDWAANLCLIKLSEAGVMVPDEVSILGVDDDWLARAFAPIEISSIALQAEEVGATAGRIALAFHRGEGLPSETLRLPPVGIVERASTEALLAVAPAWTLSVDIYGDQGSGNLNQFESGDQMVFSVSSDSGLSYAPVLTVSGPANGSGALQSGSTIVDTANTFTNFTSGLFSSSATAFLIKVEVFGMNNGSERFAIDNIGVTAIPEGSTVALLGVGALFVGWVAVRRRK